MTALVSAIHTLHILHQYLAVDTQYSVLHEAARERVSEGVQP